MAFSTEFVMGAGGSVEVEEIPVSMSGSGNGTMYPLTTVDAGGGAWIVITGMMVPAGTGNSRPYLHVGSEVCDSPHAVLTGSANLGIGALATGTVAISIQSRALAGTTTFTGKVHVVRL